MRNKKNPAKGWSASGGKKTLRITIAVMVVVVIGVTAWLFNSQKSSEIAQASWFNEDWYYRQKLTIDETKVTATLTDFPIAVQFSTTGNNPYANTNSDGSDIRFVDNNGNLLKYEIEKWNESGTSTVWVKLPSVASTTETIFYFYYGNPSAQDDQEPAAVWDDNYVAVYHMNTTTADQVLDSTSNNNDLSLTNTIASSTTSILDGGVDLDGSSSRLEAADSASLDVDNQDFTLETWFFLDTDNANTKAIVTKAQTATASNYNYYIDLNGNETPQCSDTGTDILDFTNTVSINEWSYVACSFDVNNDIISGYINESIKEVYSGGTVNPTPNAYPLDIGTFYSGGYSEWFPGVISEIRISKALRSDAWLKATYYSGTDQLISFATEEQGPGPVGYWKFDEGYGQTAYDGSPNNYDGELGSTAGVDANDPSWREESFCRFGKCLDFDGSDDGVDLGTVTQYNDFTMSAWVKPNSSGSDQDIFAYGFSFSGNDGATLKLDSNNYLSVLHGSNDSTSVSGLTPLALNTWYHVVATVEWLNGNTKVYINGRLVKFEQLTVASGWDTSKNGIGQDGDGLDEFNGIIDEVKLYNYIRSADQIKEDYNLGFTAYFGASADQGLSDGLVGYWPMDESASSTCDTALYDSCDASGNGNDGNWFGDTTATTTAKFGRATEFVAANDSYIITNDDIKLDNDLTVSIWTKYDGYVNQGSSANAFISRGDISSANGYGLYINSDNIPRFNYGWQTAAEWSSALNDGNWHHLVGVRRGSNLEIWIDGIKGSDGRATGSLPNTGINIYIGGDEASTRYIDGQLDEVRVYNRALSPDEVRRLYEWAPGPVMHMKFDENTGTSNVYSSAAATTSIGVMNNLGEEDWVSGIYGSALDFDGVVDYIEIDDNDALDLNVDNYTIMAWIFPRSWGQSSNGRLIDHGGGFGAGGGWTLNLEGGNDNFELQINGVEYEAPSSGILDLNKWQHIAAVVKDGNFEAYVNGELESNAPTTGVQRPDKRTDPIRIGMRATDALRNFDGIIDDVKLYDYARSPRQVLEDMNGGQRNNPILYWPFDEGQGNTAYDQGVYAQSFIADDLDGTLTDMATTSTSTAWKVNGRVGGALDFDGIDDEVLHSATSEALRADTGLRNESSYSVWFKADSDGENDSGKIISNDSNNFINVQSEGSDGLMDLRGSVELTGSNATLVVSDVVRRGQWHHVVMTWANDSDDEIRLYLDGEFLGQSTNGSGGANTDNADFTVGGDDSTNYNFDGMIDEVKVYNYELTMDEIRENYNAGLQTMIGNPAGAPSEVAEGLVGWWKMDESATWDTSADQIKDYSGLDNHGTSAGNANSTSTAKFGRAGEFDGTGDYINNGSATNLDDMPAVSASAWIYPRSNGTNWYGTIVEKGCGDSSLQDGWRFGFEGDGGALQRLHFAHDYSGTSLDIISANDAITLNVWQHVAVIWDGTASKDSARIFVDGSEVVYNGKTGATGSRATDNVQSLLIGRTSCGGGEFDGMIDEVKVWNVALSPDQIMREYADTKPPIAHWKMDEKSGATTEDSSGYGNQGVISGADWKTAAECKKGACLSFDGIDDYVDMGSADILDNLRVYSISAWIYYEGNSENADPRIVDKAPGSSSESGPVLYIGGAGQEKLTLRHAWTDTPGGDVNWASPASSIAYNRWYFIAATYDATDDSNDAVLYIDGISQTVTESGGPPIGVPEDDSGDDLSIGNASGSYDREFDGFIDEVKIYDYILTPRQVAMEYNSGGPVGYWKFDKGEGGTTYDYSGNGNDGTIYHGTGGSNTATSTMWSNGATGKLNGSMDFDGNDDWVGIPNTSLLQLGRKDWTISTWFNSDSATTQRIVEKTQDGGDSEYNLKFKGATGEASVQIEISSNSGGEETVGANLQTDTWYHFLATFDSSELDVKIYINGEEQATTGSVPALPDDTSTDLNFGRRQYVDTEHFNGQIDEVKIWNYVMTPEDVKRDYNAGFATFFQ